MKRLLIVIISTLSLFCAGAQDVTFFVKGGIGASSWNGSDSFGTDPKFSYRLGVGLDKHIKYVWGFQTGLYFTTAGVSMEADNHKTGLDNDINGKIDQLYLEIPLMATITAPIGKKANIIIGFGPYLAAGVGGKCTASVDLGGGHSVSEDINTFGSMSDGNLGFKRFDAGLALNLNFEIKRIIFGLDTRFGCFKFSRGTDTYGETYTDKIRNYTGQFVVGYRF